MAEGTKGVTLEKQCDGCEIVGGVVGTCALLNALTDGMSPGGRAQAIAFLRQPRGVGITRSDVLDDLDVGAEGIQPPFAKVVGQLAGNSIMQGVIGSSGAGGSKMYYLEDETLHVACSLVTGEARQDADSAISMVGWLEAWFKYAPYKDFIIDVVQDPSRPFSKGVYSNDKSRIKPVTELYEDGIVFTQEHEMPVKGKTQKPRSTIIVPAETRAAIRGHASEASTWQDRIQKFELSDGGVDVSNNVVDYLLGSGRLPVLTVCSLEDMLIIRDKIRPRTIGHSEGQSALAARSRQMTMLLDKILEFWVPNHQSIKCA